MDGWVLKTRRLTQTCCEHLHTAPVSSPEAYQVILQRVGPDVVFDDLPELVGARIRVVSEPGEEALWLLVLPLLASFVWRLARALRQVLGRKQQVNRAKRSAESWRLYTQTALSSDHSHYVCQLTFPDFHLISVDLETGFPLSFTLNSLERTLLSK